jgi:hypothetical protein
MNTLLSNPRSAGPQLISGGSGNFATVWPWRRIGEKTGRTFGRDSAVSALKGASRFCLPFSMRRKLWRLKDSITQGVSGDSPSPTIALHRVAHSFAHFAKGCGIARNATALAMLISSSALCAQTASCGLSSITEASKLTYPPIAIAARLQSDVILMTSFAPSGEVLSLRVLSGSEMLRQVAQDFVAGWHVNRYGGPRECAIVIRFRIGKEGDKPKTTVTRIDPQHVLITAESYPTSGPSYSVASK